MATVGGGLMHDTHCWLDHGNILSPSHLVMGQEIPGMVKKFMEEINVSTDTLTLDLIHKVGASGTFLMEPYTMRNFKKVFYPELFQRTKTQAPGTSVESTLDDRLRTRTLELMKANPENSLPLEIVKECDLRQKKWGTLQ
ncbi:hypothetical protein JCM12294_23590 [Desulfocicer niacini]